MDKGILSIQLLKLKLDSRKCLRLWILRNFEIESSQSFLRESPRVFFSVNYHLVEFGLRLSKALQSLCSFCSTSLSFVSKKILKKKSKLS